MLKYTTAQVTFREIPDEVTLCINISNCPIHCPDCHSKELWEDIGTELTEEELNRLIEVNKGITCVCFMGGDANYEELTAIFGSVFNWCIDNKTELKTALYSGRSSIQELLDKAGIWIKTIDYIKVGPYIKFCGGLDHKTTNQRLYKISPFSSLSLASKRIGNSLERVCGNDITYKFWKKD